jgi:DNA transposition AAA+ family ATPase
MSTTTIAHVADAAPAQHLREASGPKSLNNRQSEITFETAVASLAEDQREILSWWFYLAQEEELSLRDLEAKSGVSAATFSRLFKGAYGAADLTSICKTLAAAKDNLSQSIENPEFIMTSLAKELWEIFETARDLRTVMLAWGAMGIGKTIISMEFRRTHNHGKTYYHRCSPAMTFGQFVVSLARSMGIAVGKHSIQRLRDRIIHKLAAGKRLLIVDELHELFLKRTRCKNENAIAICEFIREIYDRAQCGLVLIGTRTMIAEFLSDENRGALAQLLDRGLDPIELPAKPTQEDAAKLIHRFGLPALDAAAGTEANQIVGDIFVASGLRKLTTHLRNGARHAAKKGEPYGWTHFVAAHKRLASLTKPKKRPA